MIIDMHSHFVPRTWPDLDARFGGGDWPGIRHTGPGAAMLTVGSRDFRPVQPALWDAAERLSIMDRDGVDIQVLCATPFLFGYQRAPAQALECAQLFNDAALEL
ncbi:MAG: amidohydrolase, partial [Betaproteobacteria bacterium]